MKVCPKCYTDVEEFSRFCPNCGTQIPVEKKDKGDALLGTTLVGKFLFKKKLGSGAMGSVYKAEQINLGKEVCIKVLHPHLVGDPSLSARFHREAKAASRLKHPNCINVIDFGVAEGSIHYIAMDYLEGRDLSHVISKEGPLDTKRILHFAIQIASALDEAHSASIIHRDLKPENVMVEDRRHQKDFVTVLDFGIAKITTPGNEEKETFHTMAGVVCGTPEYMSPEQGRGDELDPRSDLYALGIILYQMTTGKLPFTAETPIGIVTKHLTETAVPANQLNPNIDPGLQDLITALMSKKREQRPATAMDVRKLLEAIKSRLDGEGQAYEAPATATLPAPSSDTEILPSTDAGDPLDAPKKKPPLALLVGLPAALVLVAAVLFLVFKPAASPKAEDTAKAEPVATAPAPTPAPAPQPAPPPEPEKPAPAKEAAPTPPPTSPDDAARTAALAKVKDWREDLVKLTSRLTARQSELIRLGVTEDVGEVTKSLAALTGVNQALSKASDKMGSLTKDEVEARMDELEVQVDEASYAAYALVGKPLPTADELDARKRRQDLAQRAAYDAEDLEKAFSALESPLKTRADEWKQAQRSDKTAEFDALLGSVEKSKTDLAAFKPRFASASEDELSRTMEAFKKAKDELNTRSQALLAEKVVSAKDLDEQKKLEAAKRAKAAETAAAQKSTQKAAAGAQTAAAAQDDAEARAKNLADQADAMFNSGKYPTAIGLYKQALRIKDRTDIHLNLGKSYNSVGNYPEGAKHLKIYLQRMSGKLSPVKEQLIRRQIRE